MATDRDIVAENRRLTILQLLAKDPDYSLNDAILGDLLRMRGHAVASSVLHADLAWLERIDLITVNDLPGTRVAILRSEGLDVAQGTASVPGIARPRPE